MRVNVRVRPATYLVYLRYRTDCEMNIYTQALPKEDLKVIWGLADDAPLGKLTKAQFFKAVKLIAVRQGGGELSDNSISLPSALPGFQGIDLSNAAAAGAAAAVDSEMDSVQLELGLSPPQMQHYQSLWVEADTVDGVLPAHAGVQFFTNSGLVTSNATARPLSIPLCPYDQEDICPGGWRGKLVKRGLLVHLSDTVQSINVLV